MALLVLDAALGRTLARQGSAVSPNQAHAGRVRRSRRLRVPKSGVPNSIRPGFSGSRLLPSSDLDLEFTGDPPHGRAAMNIGLAWSAKLLRLCSILLSVALVSAWAQENSDPRKGRVTASPTE